MNAPSPSPENFPVGKPARRFLKPMITVRMEPELKKRLDDRIANFKARGDDAAISQNDFCIEAITSLLDYWDAEGAADANHD